MIQIDDFISDFSDAFPDQKAMQPWEITDNLKDSISHLIATLDEE